AGLRNLSPLTSPSRESRARFVHTLSVSESRSYLVSPTAVLAHNASPYDNGLDEAALAVGLMGLGVRRIGEGTFVTVFLSSDGKYVIKWVRSEARYQNERGEIIRVPVTEEQAERIARETVELNEVLRNAGRPIPYSFVPEGHPRIIVQEVAHGLTYED